MPADADRRISPIDLSVVIPVFNEEGNIRRLCERLMPVLAGMGLRFEVILVNDGSRDGSLAEMRASQSMFPGLGIVDLRRNYGQTAALVAGFDHARGRVIVALDADLQNDPEDIPALVRRLDEGFDVVSGWRSARQDAAVTRNLVSRMANRLISFISGVKLHDYGCTLKAYRADILSEIRLYGEMHRFIPIFVSWQGGRITEMMVQHHQRTAGRSKYGLNRILKVILDLIVVKFLHRHQAKPIYVFGTFGVFCLGIGGFAFACMLWLKFFEGVSMIQTPLPMLSVMGVIMGVMSILMGLLAEMVMRTYFESQSKSIYAVRERFGCTGGAS